MTSMEQLLDFLFRLQGAKMQFKLDCVRDAIMVVVPTPGRYYEVEFFPDGRIEVQTFGPPSDVKSVTLQDITDAVIRDVTG